jgi:hypothetical protein
VAGNGGASRAWKGEWTTGYERAGVHLSQVDASF